MCHNPNTVNDNTVRPGPCTDTVKTDSNSPMTGGILPCDTRVKIKLTSYQFMLSNFFPFHRSDYMSI